MFHRQTRDWFLWYCRVFMLKSNFHAVRIAADGLPPATADLGDRPLVMYANHPSWWDPVLGLLLMQRFYADRPHYAPIDAEMLQKYGVFKRMGFFGVEQHARRGAVTFLRVSSRILKQPSSAMLITPTGQFADPRDRSTPFQGGLGHLAERMSDGVLLPLAMEYTFWNERYPEALVRFGEPVWSVAHAGLGHQQWTEMLQQRLHATQDALAQASIRRDPGGFQTLSRGAAGIGGLYDLWRRVVAWARGREFQPEHDPEPSSRP